jgi:branched-chain amino acid transport system ATP-binding protein/urea transport system ATP-binding protein
MTAAVAAAAAAAPILEIRGVHKVFGALKALDGVDMQVRAGEFHGLIGPNGSGKSTLMKAIAGEHLPTSGTVTFKGGDITRATPSERSRAGMSIKFQITSVLPGLTVYDNVLLATQAREGIGSLLRSSSRRRLHGKVWAALEQFRMLHRADDVASSLSHGEQQWLEIAMAMATGPDLLLLDEPTAGMSIEERRITGELLEPIRGRCAVVIVEHDLDFIREICDVLTVLDQGAVLNSGTIETIQNCEKVRQVYVRRT